MESKESNQKFIISVTIEKKER